MKKAILIFTILGCLFYTDIKGQNNQHTLYSLARQAAQDGELEKAISYYEELYKQNPIDNYYRELIVLYPKVDDFKSAERLIKKQSKLHRNRIDFAVDLGQIYFLQKDHKKANNYFEEALKNLDANQINTYLLANKFNFYGQYEYAEKTYLKARKLLKNESLFHYELANSYGQQGKTEEMVGEYLNIIRDNPNTMQTIKNVLQRLLHPDPDNKQRDNLRQQLLKRIQSEPRVTAYSDLLIWLYIQDKDFEAAFIQSRALDSRLNEKGNRLITLGNLALSNQAYDAAEKCFNYVIKLGHNEPYFMTAKIQLVEVYKERVFQNPQRTTKELRELNALYNKSIQDLGRNALTTPLLRSQAELQAYYLSNIDTAILILENVIQQRNLEQNDLAACKIDLGDLMLLNNDIWEASLLYSQVEKAFKYDNWGDLAKFKNSKIAFYTGDFYWAQAQLNVLKGSTSKLIANDAMELSLLITDNIGLDSIVEPLEFYARADLEFAKKNYDKAEETLDSIQLLFPASSLQDEVLFKKFQIYKEQLDYKTAAEFLRKLLATYADDILGDNALFELAKLEEEVFDNQEEAMKLYKQLMVTYPSSLFVVESRKRFRRLRGDDIDSTEYHLENNEL